MVILVLMCGGLLLMAQVQVGMRQRQQELVIYRTLGASRKLLCWTLWNEFALLGLVAGAVAAIGAEAALMLLQRRVFDFPARLDSYLWWALPLGVCCCYHCSGPYLAPVWCKERDGWDRIGRKYLQNGNINATKIISRVTTGLTGPGPLLHSNGLASHYNVNRSANNAEVLS